MFIPAVISVLAVDSLTKSPVVILKEVDGERKLPIWIGLLEANAIASELEGIKFRRPLTHDLIKNIIELSNMKVSRIEVCDLKENTFYALIYITGDEKEFTIDARPSDALALSLRVRAPIFVADEVFEKSGQFDLQAEPLDSSEEGKKWQEILEKINPDDFGNS